MSEGEKPIPVPRPRQLRSTDEPDAAPKVYENYVLPVKKVSASVYDDLNAQLNQLKVEAQRPVPTPRARIAVASKKDYENSPESAKPLNNQHVTELSPSRQTGAIRKTSNIPNIRNNLDSTESSLDTSGEGRDFDVMSQNSSTSDKSSADSKYNTPSPG